MEQSQSFTVVPQDDIIGVHYSTLEEVPSMSLSQLKFTSETIQVFYISLDKQKALECINTQSIPVNSTFYEYIENISVKDGEVILAVEVDTSNILDLTNVYHFNAIKNCNVNEYMKEHNINILRLVKEVNSLIYKQYVIVLRVFNNSPVRRIYKAVR